MLEFFVVIILKPFLYIIFSQTAEAFYFQYVEALLCRRKVLLLEKLYIIYWRR